MEYIDVTNYTDDTIDKLKKVIKSGGVVIIPTDTVYGLAADSLNPDAIKRIYEIKKRDFSNPMNILVSNIDMIKKVTNKLSQEEENIIENFFPGALTIILEKNDSIPNIVTSNLSTVRSKNA